MTMSLSLSTPQKTRLPRFGYRISLVGTISFLIILAGCSLPSSRRTWPRIQWGTLSILTSSAR